MHYTNMQLMLVCTSFYVGDFDTVFYEQYNDHPYQSEIQVHIILINAYRLSIPNFLELASS